MVDLKKKNGAIVVNFFGGPGSRKSTMCASVFSRLKWMGINCEYAAEFAKDLVWEGAVDILDNQIYIFGHQHHRIWRLAGNTDVILTDSPLLLTIVYDQEKREDLRRLVLHEMARYINVNFFLRRVAKFQQAGRVQNEEQSKEKDQEIMRTLNELSIPYFNVSGDETEVGHIVEEVLLAIRMNGEYV